MVLAKEDQNRKEEVVKGFGGINSLVSNVDISPSNDVKNEPASATTTTERPAIHDSQHQQSTSQQHQPNNDEAQSMDEGSSGGIWFLVIATVIGALSIIGLSGKSPTSTNSYSLPEQTVTPSYSPPAESQAPSRPQESMPPVGQDLVFSTAQIRYCLAEDIRMESAKSALNNYIGSDVEYFNAKVADYNSRCGHFRYRRGALESARRDIEPYRSQLQTEGKNIFWPQNKSTPSKQKSSVPFPDETLQTIQQKLNQLGYEAGSADGFESLSTRSAIIAFQKDRGLTVTGVVDKELLVELQSPPRQLTANSDVTSQSSLTSTKVVDPTTLEQQSLSSKEPDLSIATPSEQASIENACGYHKRVNGPADYYQCQQTQLSKLSNSGGQPDLSMASPSERASIENACGYHKRVNGPADYYQCQQTQLSKLSNSGGQPDLSMASPSEQTSIENACGYHKRVNGPADYYSCLKRELSKLGITSGIEE